MAIFSSADARRAVERGFDDSVRFLTDLVGVPSLLGEEEPAQQLVEARLGELGFEVESVVPDPARLAERPDSGIPLEPYEGRRSLVGAIGEGGGRSLVLNGHVDVVSAEPVDRWTKEPFGAEISDSRMYGRGSCDMKGGVAAMLLGVEAALSAGPLPSRLFYQSVIEEECGGNGALAAVLAGPRADDDWAIPLRDGIQRFVQPGLAAGGAVASGEAFGDQSRRGAECMQDLVGVLAGRSQSDQIVELSEPGEHAR